MDIQALLDEISNDRICRYSDVRLQSFDKTTKWTKDQIFQMGEEINNGSSLVNVSKKYTIGKRILMKWLAYYKVPMIPAKERMSRGGKKGGTLNIKHIVTGVKLSDEEKSKLPVDWLDVIEGMDRDTWCAKYNKTHKAYEGVHYRLRKKGLL
jgi:hypothetical protein